MFFIYLNACNHAVCAIFTLIMACPLKPVEIFALEYFSAVVSYPPPKSWCG